MNSVSRRDFLKLSGAIGACACCLGTLTLIESCSTSSKTSATAKPNITETADQLTVPKTMLAGGFATVQSRRFSEPIFVTVNADGSYTAVRLLCTHKGCTVHPGQGKLVCPCHGSEFTLDGHVTKGPAKTDLQTFTLTTDDSNVYLHFT